MALLKLLVLLGLNLLSVAVAEIIAERVSRRSFL